MCPGKYILNKRWLGFMALFLFYRDYIVVLSLKAGTHQADSRPSWSFLFIDHWVFSVCSAPLAEVGPRRLAFGRFDMSVSLIILIRCSAGEPVCENDKVSKRWCQEGTHRTLILFVCISHSDASTEQRIVYVFLEKCASGHKFCHFEIIYHDVVIRGKWLSINWDNKLKCTGDHRLFKKRDFARVGE